MRAAKNNKASPVAITAKTANPPVEETGDLKESLPSKNRLGKDNLLLRTISNTAGRAFHSWENTLEKGLARQGSAFSSIADLAIATKDSISNTYNSIATDIAEESGAGISTIRKSVAYKLAVSQMRRDLNIRLEKAANLTPEQKDEVRELATGELAEIREKVSEKIERLLVENADIDYSRSALRAKMPQIVEEGVNAVSKLTQDVKATLRQYGDDSMLSDTYSKERERKTLGSQDRSRIVNFVGGKFQPNKTATLETSDTTEKPLLSAKPDSLKVQEPVAKLNPVQGTTAKKLPDAETVISQSTTRQLKAIVRALGSANSELKIVGYGDMSKAELVTALTTSDRLAYYIQNPEVVKAVSKTTVPAAATHKTTGKSTKVRE